MRGIAIGSLVLFLGLAGCFSPSYPSGLACGVGAEACPPGQRCGPDGFCSANPGGTDDAALPDDGDATGPPVDGAFGAWVREDSGTTQDLLGIWGASATEIWAVGRAGTILRRGAGGQWSVYPSSPTGLPLNAIAGSSATNVWAVGDGSTLIAWDGTSWIQHNSPTTGTYVGVAFDNAGTGMAITNQSTAVYSNGGWMQVPPPTTGQTAVFSDGASFWVAADGVFRSETGGTGWTAEGQSGIGTEAALWSPSTDPTNVFAVGNVGKIARKVGSSWVIEDSKIGGILEAIDGTSATDLWVVGQNGVTHRVADATWVFDDGSPGGNAILALSPTLVLVVGNSGAIYRRMF